MITREITLLVFDSKENFNKPEVQMHYGGKALFKKLICFSDEEEFIESIENLDNNEKFIIACHINYENFSGYFNFRNTNIKNDHSLNNIVYVSSGDSGEVMKGLFDTHKVAEKVILYSELISSIEKGDIKPITKMDLILKKTIDVNKKAGIFLSHSSLDRDEVIKFRDYVLVQGLKYDVDCIKFTSDEATGVPGGIDIPTDLSDNLINNTGLFIQFLSENYEKSRVCLNEEGAGWVLFDQLMFIPVFLKGFTHGKLSWIKNHSKGIKINDKESLLNLYNDRKNFFGEDVNIAILNQKIDEFISSITI